MPKKKKLWLNNFVSPIIALVLILILLAIILWQKGFILTPKQNDLGLTVLTARNLNADDLKTYQDAVATLQTTPEEKAAALNLGYIYRQQGLYQDAEKAFNYQLQFDELDGEALLGLARVYTDEGKYKDAEDAYYKIIDVYPLYMIAYHELLALYQSGKLPLNDKFITEADYSLQFEGSESYQDELKQLLLDYNLIPKE